MVSADGGFRVLVVCTGNVCRSPAIAALLTARAREAGLAPEQWLQVRSAGTHALDGAGLHEQTARALADVGVLDSPAHQAHQLIAQDVKWADLVLTATRAHRAAAARMHPPAVQRVFTLLEMAALLTTASTTSPPAGVHSSAPTPTEWAARADRLVTDARAARGRVRLDDPAELDLPDPVDAPPSAHDAVVARADAAVGVILAALTGPGHSLTGVSHEGDRPTKLTQSEPGLHPNVSPRTSRRLPAAPGWRRPAR
jgi:protein-tyrosine phosphatase